MKEQIRYLKGKAYFITRKIHAYECKLHKINTKYAWIYNTTMVLTVFWQPRTKTARIIDIYPFEACMRKILCETFEDIFFVCWYCVLSQRLGQFCITKRCRFYQGEKWKKTEVLGGKWAIHNILWLTFLHWDVW